MHSPSMSSTKQNFLKASLHCTTMTYQQIHPGKNSSDSTYLPSKFAGGLGRGCFALAFGTWHPNKVVMSICVLKQTSHGLSQQPPKRFFSKNFFIFFLTNNSNNPNLKHLKQKNVSLDGSFSLLDESEMMRFI